MFTLRPSDLFDIYHPWSEFGASSLANAIFTVVSELFWPVLINLFHAHTIFHPKPPNYWATLIRDNRNMPKNIACGAKWLLSISELGIPNAMTGRLWVLCLVLGV